MTFMLLHSTRANPQEILSHGLVPNESELLVGPYTPAETIAMIRQLGGEIDGDPTQEECEVYRVPIIYAGTPEFMATEIQGSHLVATFEIDLDHPDCPDYFLQVENGAAEAYLFFEPIPPKCLTQV